MRINFQAMVPGNLSFSGMSIQIRRRDLHLRTRLKGFPADFRQDNGLIVGLMQTVSGQFQPFSPQAFLAA